MGLANREAFLKPRAVKTIEVDAGELGTVRMRELTGSQLSKVLDWQRPNGELDKARQARAGLRLLVECVVDERNNTYLTEDDIDVLFDYPVILRDRLCEAAMALNGFGKDDEKPSIDLLGKSDS